MIDKISKENEIQKGTSSQCVKDDCNPPDFDFYSGFKTYQHQSYQKSLGNKSPRINADTILHRP